MIRDTVYMVLFRTENGSVRQGRTEFNSVRTEYGNHVVIFSQLSRAVIGILSRAY